MRAQKIAFRAHAFWSWLRFGTLTERTVAVMDGWCVMEIEYKDCRGNIVGWWAHGSFDPSLPYRGQPAKIKIWTPNGTL